MMGNSLNQLYDFIIEKRLSAQKGEISNDEAQANIDSLYIEYEKIYNNPLLSGKPANIKIPLVLFIQRAIFGFFEKASPFFNQRVNADSDVHLQP